LEVLNKKISELPVLENPENQQLLDQIKIAVGMFKEKGAIND
jgi:hypothetical protein